MFWKKRGEEKSGNEVAEELSSARESQSEGKIYEWRVKCPGGEKMTWGLSSPGNAKRIHLTRKEEFAQ